MGIKNLTNIIKKNSKNSIQNIKLNNLFNKIISIDTSIFLYKYLYNDTNYLYCFLKQIIKLVKNGITPLYVFDGKPPEEKNELLNDRKTKKQTIKLKIKLLEKIMDNNTKLEHNEDIDDNISDITYSNIDDTMKTNIYNELQSKYKNNSHELELELKKQNKRLIYVTQKHIDNLIELLELLGIPYLKTENEAEIVCAQLNKHNIVNGCLTEDSDYLTNGGNYFLRNFNVNSNEITLYKLHEVLKDLELNNDQFIDLCILYGCDYTSTIKGIGQIRGLKLIKQHKSIENIIKYIEENKTPFVIPDDFDYINARRIFKTNIYSQKELKDIRSKLVLKKPIIKDIINFFNERSVILKPYYVKELNNVVRYYTKILNYKKKKKQQKLTNYFQKGMITKNI